MIYLDCSSGIAGDMLVAALVGLGADERRIRKALKNTAKVRFTKVRKRGVKAVRFEVDYKEEPQMYTDLVKQIRRIRLKPQVEWLALRVLGILAEAESKAHDVPLEDVHLHEAADCVVDAVAASVALDDLGLLDEVFESSVVSCGAVAPATMRILREYGIPVMFRSDRELVTPTGAAFLAALVTDYGAREYGAFAAGAGSMNLPWPNVLKVASVSGPMVVLESNIDDCTPEQIRHMATSLMEAGALDVHVLPCMMKKGRIGFLVRVLSDKAKEHAAAMMAETGTLGVRVMPVDSRYELPREVKQVGVAFGGCRERVRVKYSPLGSKPESDDVSAIAKKHRLTFRKVSERIACKARKRAC